MQLEKKLGKEFPNCLDGINWNLRTKKNAIEISESLNEFFKEDINLQYFSEWLKETAKYCSLYDLSY